MHWLLQLLLSLFWVYNAHFHVAIHPRQFLSDGGIHHEHDLDSLHETVAKDAMLTKGLAYNKKATVCTPLVSCPAHIKLENNKFCETKTNRQGVYCTTGQNHTGHVQQKGRGHHMLHLDTLTLGAINRKSKAEMSKLRSREARLLSSKEPTVLQPGPAAYGHFRNSRAFDMADLSEVMNVASSALELAIATKAFKDRQGLTNEELEMGMVNQDLRDSPFSHACVAAPFCPLVPDKYRRIDGACNNVLHPTWGAPFTPYSRLLPPLYQDGIWAPRHSVVDDEPLSSPRLISSTVISDIDVPNYEFTLMIMQFGQFISHDITQSMDMSFVNGSAISCCDSDGSSMLPPEATHYSCMPIPIPASDPFFSKFKQRCMNFVRSILAPRHDCTMGYAQQMNKLTHYLDASLVYGSTPEQTRELRSFHTGQLKVFNDFGRDLPPLSKDPNACLTMEQGSACFESGDTRTNQMISLVVLHTLFLREHNRIAHILSELNPHWHDEQLFLEARQILIAELQVIIYKEFLPAVIGPTAMDEFGLTLEQHGKYSLDYNPQIDPSATNEFAAAALRFGHSAVDGQLKIYGATKMEEIIPIPEVMFFPSRMRQQKFLDEMLSTLSTEPIQSVDGSLTDALTKYMFRGGNPFGVDLAAINIQRGRDHGLRPYNDYRELTGLPRLKDFSEFGPEMEEKLSKVYKSVDDMDLWLGGILEEKAPGSLVGPTFRDMIADQFARFKKGDRYFFEHDPSINPGYFTPEQLQELRKASMSRVICDNSDKILLSRQAPNAFRKPGVSGNEFMECAGSGIPSINLLLWQE